MYLDDLQAHLLDELNYDFDIFRISEPKISSSAKQTTLNLNISGSNFVPVPTPSLFGDVGLYIHDKYKYSVIERTFNKAFQAMWIEIHFENKKNIVCGIVYREHNSPNTF